ncbi:long-chain fatty acid--CoA ligase [Alteriqipengyuania flavescens]|uniref:long-chain fatty acid--CoA ligase n=1 Tax=Alteriqipengyuania flavescens TaxID=3053610 RepID=UPI0025B36C20|nr:long-chain fatty acid--CoA ligase [Alteriqipengyuania flavescens]WJY18486.1 long-chain fatty acid--CoA ligase [Alteriqipengyuania flavescens]WJY24427.1 long-chain fatty acid--CoA ligase [Alteriqipengyuania flavescens]
MLGAMQGWTMRVTRVIDHAAREAGSREIVTRWADGSETRTDWAGIRRDAKKMAQALQSLGVKEGDRVASLAMNHSRHLVSWYGVAGMGGVLHTVNPRLFEDQLEFIANHAEDRVLLYDAMFQPIVDKMRDRWTTIEHYICYDSGEHNPAFEDWIAPYGEDFDWVEGDERDPCMLCYTSGTTGNPKGVLYEHRSTVLHALVGLQPAAFNFSASSVMLPVVPMFHAASWGLPYAGAMAGIKFVFSAVNEPAVLDELMKREGVTDSAGVPTVWLAHFQYCDATGTDLPKLKSATIGGSAAPKFMIERLMKNGTRVQHAWGMTETSPIGTVGGPTADWDQLSFEEKVGKTAMQGRPVFGVELRTVDLDDMSTELPRDGKTSGALQIRGPWVIKRYFKAEEDAVDADGWFDTGDVGILHPDGTLQLTDRTKDVIKSGGEWISSVELENAAVGHPAVAEAAAIGMPHPKWDERPVLFVVKKDGADCTGEEVTAFLVDKVAKWWLPDAVEFVDDIPHTATGKISKKDLRARFADYTLES